MKNRQQAGSALITVIIITSFLMSLALYFLNSVSLENKIATARLLTTRSHYLAEAAINDLTWQLDNNPSMGSIFSAPTSTIITTSRAAPFNFNDESYRATATNIGDGYVYIAATGIISHNGAITSTRTINTKAFRPAGSSLASLASTTVYSYDDINLYYSNVALKNGYTYTNGNINSIGGNNIFTQMPQGTAASSTGCSSTVPTLPDSITVPITIRDFMYKTTPATNEHHAGNPDFENYLGGLATGLIKNQLGADGKPQFLSSTGNGSEKQITNANSFDSWYHDGDGYTINSSLTFVRQPSNSYIFDSATDQPYKGLGGFFPINNQGWQNPNSCSPCDDKKNPPDWCDQCSGNNFAFTSELHYPFTFKGGEILNFSGDDDVWVFINGHLAVDLGGVHSNVSGSVKLDATHANQFGLISGNIYNIDIFQAERHTTGSNYKLTLFGVDQTAVQCQSICGNGVVESGEECDSGLATSTNQYGACGSDCKIIKQQEMLGLNFDKYKQNATLVFNSGSDFENWLWNNYPNANLNSSIIYINGDLNLKGGFNLTTTGLLVVNGNVNIGQQQCWQLSATTTVRCGNDSLAINTNAQNISGIIAKGNINFSSWAASININGTVYANNELNILNLPLNASFNINGGTIARKTNIIGSQNNITVNYNKNLMTNSLNTYTIGTSSPAILFDYQEN